MPVASALGVKQRPIYVATTRKRADPSDNIFTSESAGTLNYARFVVGIPPNHKQGQIEWPDGTTNSGVNFTTIEQAVLTGPEFRDALAPSKSSRQ